MRASWLFIILAIMIDAGGLGCARHVTLEERAVDELSRARQMTQRKTAYERARSRLPRLQREMSVAEVEEAMGATIAIERTHDAGTRAKLLDGFLCAVDLSPLRRRWLFGYADEGIVLVGFALEFERIDVDEEEWFITSIDQSPEEECPE